METYDRKIRALSDVIAGLTGCIVGNCSNCEYADSDCHRDDLMEDAVDLLKEYRELKIAVAASDVLERYRPAFEALAKGEE